MKDAGIFDGDIAVLDGKAEARDGMIAAILMQDETTLKRIYRQPKGILLKAENRAFRDIELGPDETERTRLMGVLVGIVRKI